MQLLQTILPIGNGTDNCVLRSHGILEERLHSSHCITIVEEKQKTVNCYLVSTVSQLTDSNTAIGTIYKLAQKKALSHAGAFI